MARTRDRSERTMDILKNLAIAPVPARRGKTAPFGNLLTWLLSEAVSISPPGTRLPAIREIAAIWRVSPMPVQHAVHQLIRQGLLVSRDKSGVFVAGSPDSAVAAASELGFGTESVAAWQRIFWNEIAADFHRLDPDRSITLRLLFGGGRNAEGYTWDLREITNSEVVPSWEQFEPLHADHVSPFDRVSAHLVRDRGIRLYARTYWLFFNRELLRRLRLPEPDYTDWDGQVAYLRRISARTAALGLAEKPYAAYHPTTLIAGELADLEIPGGELPTDFARHPAWGRLRRFFEEVLVCPVFDSETVFDTQVDFLTGRMPLLFSYSVQFWHCCAVPLSFEWGAYPVYTTDSKRFKSTVPAGVHRGSGKLADALRFAEFLLSPPVQERFAATGHLPADDPAPAAEYDFGDRNRAIKQILEPELFRAAAGIQSWEQAIANAIARTRMNSGNSIH